MNSSAKKTSFMTSMGISRLVVVKILNHVESGITPSITWTTRALVGGPKAESWPTLKHSGSERSR